MTAPLMDYPAPMVESREWLTRIEAAKRLKIGVQTLDRYVSAGKIKRYKLADSRLTRFRSEDVNALLGGASDAPNRGDGSTRPSPE